MRIQTIEITDYKAFLGTHKINVGGKKISGHKKISGQIYFFKLMEWRRVSSVDKNRSNAKD